MNSLLRSLDYMREVEENAFHPDVLLEDFCQLRTVAATNVRNDTDPREIVSVENGVRFPTNISVQAIMPRGCRLYAQL